MKKLFTSIFLLFLLTGFGFAQGIKGTVIDKKTGEPLIGATVHIKSKGSSSQKATSTGLDGSFSFKGIATGEYEVEAKYISYKDESKNVNVTNGATATVVLRLDTKGSDLREVNIGARAAGNTDQSARRTEQRADQVINAVSARAIEISPDVTVANVMQRVSGVSVERSANGEAQYPIIRGMEKRYISTLVNGVKIPSPDNKNRYVPLDIFPADIVDRLEVYKSLTPSMEADAIGGAVNLILKDAPDRLTINANAALGGQSLSNSTFTTFNHGGTTSQSPRVANGNSYVASNADFSTSRFSTHTDKNAPLSNILGLTIGGRMLDNKLGVLGSVSYQNTYRATNTTYFKVGVNQTDGSPKVTDIEARQYSTQQERTGLHAKADYRFNSQNKIDLYAAYMNLTQNQFRMASDTDLTLGRTAIGNGRVSYNQRSSRMIQQIYNVTLKGTHKISDLFRTDWSLVYSKATANEPDRATIDIARGVSSTGAQLVPAYDLLHGVRHTWANNSDRDKAAYLNFTYSPKIAGTVVDFSTGGMYRDKSRSSAYDEYNFRPEPATQPVVDDINNATLNLFNKQGTGDDALNYDFHEKVGAYYGQFKFTAGKLQTIGGIRTEYTNQDWVTAAGPKVEGTIGSISYYDVLPSLAFKYMLNDKQNLRLSYYSAVSRPGFYELVPHIGGDPEADYQEIGNPKLKRVTADNFDLRYEIFPKGLDQLLVGVFYKNINNPIEFAIVPDKPGSTSYVYSANNFGTGRNYGFELDFTKYVHNFGIKANYTYTNSEITTAKRQWFIDPATNSPTFKSVDQTRPLQGQSKHIANVAFLYKNVKRALDAQIAMVYTGSRINTVSTDYGNDIWQKGFVQLDVSVEKKVVSHLFVYVKANNLLNTPFELEVKKPYIPGTTVVGTQVQGENIRARKDLYGQNYLLGLRYKF